MFCHLSPFFFSYTCFSLCQGEILSELISLIVEEPPADLDDNLRFKLPHIAAEVREDEQL